ncbi:MAG TPA: ParB/RepB/Spo0J family partition protein [Longimicrobiales bacterium]
MSKRDRLGKGLGALLGEYLDDEGAEDRAAEARPIAVASIAPNPFQPRREFSEEELEELSNSIRENGLLQPIAVRPAPSGGAAAWELIAGERRWRAVMRLGWSQVPALIRQIDDRAMLVLALVENLQRAELSALEEAMGYQQLADEFGLSQQEIARVVGRDRSTIANSLRLLQLPASVRQLLADGRLSAGHARALLGVGSDHHMVELARRAADEGWSVRQVEAEVQRNRPRKAQRPRPERTREAAERRLEEELQRVLGTAVRIHRKRGMKGKIEIPFYGAEDFERIYEMLVGSSVAEAVS